MNTIWKCIILCLTLVIVIGACSKKPIQSDDEPEKEVIKDSLRIASFNVSMFADKEGELIRRLENATAYTNFLRVGAIIQKMRPDVLVLMELDFDPTGQALKLFKEELLQTTYTDTDTIVYPYAYQIESNTGQLANVDIDGDGNITLPNDAYGFGTYPGQYASAILSKYPLDLDNARSFKNFLWKDMPDAALPQNEDGTSYYSEDALSAFRLSSKNHIDIPVQVSDEKQIHFLISHPTPPVFDGVEDRNGRRNHDELRLWRDYIDNASYLVDDNGISGGLTAGDNFVILGDLNADPVDGDSYEAAINQLLTADKVNPVVTTGDFIPSSTGGVAHNQQNGDEGNPAYDTSFFGLRIDYVLPSANMDVIGSGVFWPTESEPCGDWVSDKAASDHLMVWVDVVL